MSPGRIGTQAALPIALHLCAPLAFTFGYSHPFESAVDALDTSPRAIFND